MSTRASPVGSESDNSFSQRRFDYAPEGVSNELAVKPSHPVTLPALTRKKVKCETDLSEKKASNEDWQT